MLGVEVLALSILSIKGMPEMAKVLQAGAREDLLRKADEAVFFRRSAAVELERKIKEIELNTEIAVEQKKRQVREPQMEADIAVEQQRSQLVDRRIENDKKEAETIDILAGVCLIYEMAISDSYGRRIGRRAG